jgi:hypothetical protein
MSSRCIHREANGEQCPNMTDAGLFCTIHAEEGTARPADVKRRGGGGGGGGSLSGRGGRFRESIFKRIGMVYHHEPPNRDSEDDYGKYS